ncbi:DUF2147 domain-containing protein [soil metagenome]
MKKLFSAALVLAALSPFGAMAQTSPAGLWKSIDDVSGKPKSLIRITEQGGEYKGKIEKIFPDPSKEMNPLCDKCEGTQKDQPKVGMTIMSGFKQEGDEFAGGTILDPESGKVYKSKMSLAEGGKKLNVRGFVGISLFGRSQVWVREE